MPPPKKKKKNDDLEIRTTDRASSTKGITYTEVKIFWSNKPRQLHTVSRRSYQAVLWSLILKIKLFTSGSRANEMEMSTEAKRTYGVCPYIITLPLASLHKPTTLSEGFHSFHLFFLDCSKLHSHIWSLHNSLTPCWQLFRWVLVSCSICSWGSLMHLN